MARSSLRDTSSPPRARAVEERELARGELHRRPDTVAVRATRSSDPADGHLRERALARADACPHARRELLHHPGLHQVVVGPGLQAHHPLPATLAARVSMRIGAATPRRRAPGTPRARRPGEHPVDHHEVVRRAAFAARRRSPTPHVHHVALLLSTRDRSRATFRIVPTTSAFYRREDSARRGIAGHRSAR